MLSCSLLQRAGADRAERRFPSERGVCVCTERKQSAGRKVWSGLRAVHVCVCSPPFAWVRVCVVYVCMERTLEGWGGTRWRKLESGLTLCVWEQFVWSPSRGQSKRPGFCSAVRPGLDSPAVPCPLLTVSTLVFLETNISVYDCMWLKSI